MADRFRTPRKEKQWADLPAFTQALVGTSTLAIASLGFSSVQTVLRMLGEYVITPTLAPAALDEAKVTIGIGKTSTDAAALG